MRDLKGVQLPTLTDGRVTVRPFRPDDTPGVFAYCQDPESARWTKIPTPYAWHDAATFLSGAWRTWIDTRDAHLAIADAGDAGRILGSVSLMIDPPQEVGEVGYMVAPEARRKGVASAAVRLVTAWGLDDLGLQRMQIGVLVGNEASRSTAETSGFVFEGTLRHWLLQRGEPVDCWMFSLLPGDPRPW